MTNKNEELVFDFKINDSQKIGFFNSLTQFSFLLDFKTNTRIAFGKDEKEYQIEDISPDGKLVAIKSTTFDWRKRFIKIIKIKTKEIIFETNQFFPYDVLFTPNPNLFIFRADIKDNCKTFIFDFNLNEIIYTFPYPHPLEYGGVNFNNKTFVIPGKKKGDVMLFDFINLDARIINIPSKKMVHRTIQLNDRSLLLVECEGSKHYSHYGDYFMMRIDSENVIWKTKLDFIQYYYASRFFVKNNKIYFEAHPYYDENNTLVDKNYYYYSVDLNTGEIDHFQIPLKAFIREYFGECVMDCIGNILNLRTKEISKFEIRDYLQ